MLTSSYHRPVCILQDFFPFFFLLVLWKEELAKQTKKILSSNFFFLCDCCCVHFIYEAKHTQRNSLLRLSTMFNERPDFRGRRALRSLFSEAHRQTQHGRSCTCTCALLEYGTLHAHTFQIVILKRKKNCGSVLQIRIDVKITI